MLQYFEMWGEECTICFQKTDIFYINECKCIHFICITCISQLEACPFCRKPFSSDTLAFTDKYRNKNEAFFVHSKQYTNFSKNVPYTLYIQLQLFELATTLGWE